ncbi:hypothetical protein [Parafrankia sp. EUN1f]|uniref:hypothetical protein n=1 Tax=Parafrankia sp. EUN1f TaxID=102897 RepID=UPI0001C4714F|nr:hypothetical protein [Parafrankia sp. EUN1f]EFC79706.1 hypothetical protein FrEUN1fDRAFT_7176 [Parafrankia sp. EUN1f]
MHGMIDCTVAGFVSQRVHIRDLRSRSGIWASIPLGLRLPDQITSEGVREGKMRYFTVKAYDRLAEQVRDASLNIADWLIIRVADVQPNIWNDRETGRPRAGIDLIAASIEFRPERDRVEQFTAGLTAAR